MSDNTEIVYRYRRWPFLVPTYAVFSLLYHFLVYHGENPGYAHIAETGIMSLFFLSPLAPTYFDLRIRKISAFSELLKSLFASFVISAFLIFALMLSYLQGEAWFGALALMAFYLAYNIVFFPLAFLLFRVSLRAKRNEYA